MQMKRDKNGHTVNVNNSIINILSGNYTDILVDIQLRKRGDIVRYHLMGMEYYTHTYIYNKNYIDDNDDDDEEEG